jgi:hypothetical protein
MRFEFPQHASMICDMNLISRGKDRVRQISRQFMNLFVIPVYQPNDGESEIMGQSAGGAMRQIEIDQ